jgi:Golgi phosphoprotein 3
MSTEGLTRRRAGGGASPAIDSSSTPTFDGPSHNALPSRSAGPSSAVEGRGKIAYDPRDFEDKGEATKMPRLTLMEEILLLGLKDKAVSLTRARTHATSSPGDGNRATYHSGTTTSRTRCAVAS